MKKFILIIAIIGLLAGCKNPSGSTHTHHFGTAWKSNATHHWHECEADGKKAGEAPHTWDWVETAPATTEAEGQETETCTVCRTESGNTRPVEKLTEPHTHIYGTTWVSDATHHWHECEADGKKAGEAPHTWDWVETAPATTEAEGQETETCTVCRTESGNTRPVEKLTEPHTHIYGTTWVSDATQHWRECDCGDKADIANHTWGAWTQTTAPTLTTAGIETRECSICHKEDTQEVEPLPPISPPEIKVFFIPQPFSPDGDGVDDELTVNIDVESESEVISWHIEIHEPTYSYLLFSEWEGEGMPPKTLVWDGLSASGELVQSASAYHFTLTVNNGSYNYTYGGYDYTYQGTIAVDVLVRREGDIFRIVVPINTNTNAPFNGFYFASNSDAFISGVSPEIAANNEAILQRIAEILNSPEFSNYSIRVEGHLNPSTPPGTTARRDEEQGTRRQIGLIPLSQNRAKAVADYLADYGIEGERLTSVGFGGTQTIIAFEDRDNWWKNHRIEFILEEL